MKSLLITLPAPDGDDQAKLLTSFVFMYISICVQGLNILNFSDQNFSLVVVLSLGKSQPGCSYKVCSYETKSVYSKIRYFNFRDKLERLSQILRNVPRKLSCFI